MNMNYKPSNDENIFRPMSESAPSGFVKLKTKSQVAKEAVEFFGKKENIFKIKWSKNKEKDLEVKKNILSEKELNKQIEDLKVQIIQFKKDKEKLVQEFNIYKKKELSSLMKQINPIIAEYVKEKTIDLVLDKKNILIGEKPINKLNDLFGEISLVNEIDSSQDRCNIIFDSNYLSFKQIISHIDNLQSRKKIKFWFLSEDYSYVIGSSGMNQKGNIIFFD